MRDPIDIGLIFVFVFRIVFPTTLGYRRSYAASISYCAFSSAPIVLACVKIGLGLTIPIRSISVGL